MPEEIIMNCESETTENLEDGILESSTLAKIGSDDVKDHVFQEIEMNLENGGKIRACSNRNIWK